MIKPSSITVDITKNCNINNSSFLHRNQQTYDWNTSNWKCIKFFKIFAAGKLMRQLAFLLDFFNLGSNKPKGFYSTTCQVFFYQVYCWRQVLVFFFLGTNKPKIGMTPTANVNIIYLICCKQAYETACY